MSMKQIYGSRKEKHHFHHYLTSLVKALENKHTIIDLRNESCVSGLIKYVDGLMNVEMENVTFYDPQGRQHKFKDFYVSARNIRYVHIPDEFSSLDLLKHQMDQLDRVNVREPKKDTFKTKRAKEYNMKILAQLHEESQAGPSK